MEPYISSIYNKPGLLRVNQILDVAFFYVDGVLYHYRGVFMGWELLRATHVETKELAEKRVSEIIANILNT